MGMGKLRVALEGPVAAYWERVGTYCLGMEWVGKAHNMFPCPTATPLDHSGWCFGSPGTPVMPGLSRNDTPR